MTSPTTVLLVDDDADVRGFMAVALRAAGYAVVEARSGEEALEIACTRRLDLMVADLVLGEMGGLELAWRVLDAGLVRGIVLVSGYTEERAALDTLPPGSVAFLPKPFDLDELVTAVQERLERSTGGA